MITGMSRDVVILHGQTTISGTNCHVPSIIRGWTNHCSVGTHQLISEICFYIQTHQCAFNVKSSSCYHFEKHTTISFSTVFSVKETLTE
uniref:Uncharacterized protein n=1 Tax=Anguilla anguilla TaxID=7936 RepID=A0A0E9R4X6_ANGAN